MLIDAEKLRAEFKADDEKPFWHYTGIWAAIESADIVDPIHAAGGCYCRECRFYCDFYEECGINEYNPNSLVNRKPDDFCSRGERR